MWNVYDFSIPLKIYSSLFHVYRTEKNPLLSVLHDARQQYRALETEQSGSIRITKNFTLNIYEKTFFFYIYLCIYDCPQRWHLIRVILRKTIVSRLTTRDV